MLFLSGDILISSTNLQCFEDVVAHWQPSTEAQRSRERRFKSGISMLASQGRQGTITNSTYFFIKKADIKNEGHSAAVEYQFLKLSCFHAFPRTILFYIICYAYITVQFLGIYVFYNARVILSKFFNVTCIIFGITIF